MKHIGKQLADLLVLPILASLVYRDPGMNESILVVPNMSILNFRHLGSREKITRWAPLDPLQDDWTGFYHLASKHKLCLQVCPEVSELVPTELEGQFQQIWNEVESSFCPGLELFWYVTACLSEESLTEKLLSLFSVALLGRSLEDTTSPSTMGLKARNWLRYENRVWECDFY